MTLIDAASRGHWPNPRSTGKRHHNREGIVPAKHHNSEDSTVLSPTKKKTKSEEEKDEAKEERRGPTLSSGESRHPGAQPK